MMPKQILIFFFAFILGSSVYAQLTTNTALTPEQLVKDVLVGQGVDVFNVTYTGAENAVGQFDATLSNVGIDKGIILSTGSVLDHVVGGKKNGPVGPNNNNLSVTAWNTPGDVDLSAVINEQTADAVVIEFDFIPQGDTIRFNYVFASEEYIEYDDPSSPFNDVFAFFISGPGFASPTNIAILPGTTTPVSIKNVSRYSNTSFYRANGTGFTGPEFTDPTVVNFDGLTVQLTAVTKVTPCKVYHLKLALADGFDVNYDSGVFLQAGSLNSNPAFSFAIDTTFTPLDTDTLMAEGCSNIKNTFKRYDKLFNPYSVDFRVLGTATDGIDYTLSTHQLNFPVNVDEVTLETISIGDDIDEGVESVILRFPSPYICVADSFDIIYNIVDQEPIITATFESELKCEGDEVEMEAIVSGGVPGYDYSWTGGGSNTSKNKVSPAFTQTYFYTVTDTCGKTKDDSAVITVPNFQPLTINISNDTTVYCPGVALDLIATGNGGGGVYDFIWDSGEVQSLVSKTILNDKSFGVVLYDNCGDTAKGSVFVDLDYTPFSVSAFNDTTICYGDSVIISALATGGVIPYQYVWETGDLTSASSYKGVVSKFVKVTATDSCGIIPVMDSVYVTIQKPTADFEIIAPVPEVLEVIYFENVSLGDLLTYEWDLGNSETSILQDAETSYAIDSIFSIKLIVEDDLGCRDTILKSIKIDPPLYFYMPNSFTPNGDLLNDQFLGKGIGVEKFDLSIYDRWGIEVFTTTDSNESWDGRSKSGKNVPVGVYVYRLMIVGESRKEIEKIGKITLIR